MIKAKHQALNLIRQGFMGRICVWLIDKEINDDN